MCLCSADPCVCEDAETQRRWAMVGYLNECAIASLNQKAARRQVPEYPPNCDFGDDE